jgi:hypothetical protein
MPMTARSSANSKRRTIASHCSPFYTLGPLTTDITEDVRKYAAEQAISEEEALKKGMEEPSAANRSAAEIASPTLRLNPRGKSTIQRIAREGEARRSQKSKDSSRLGGEGEDVCAANGRRPSLREQPSQFVEKGAEVYAKA